MSSIAFPRSDGGDAAAAGCRARQVTSAPSSAAASPARVTRLTVVKVPLREPAYTSSSTSETKGKKRGENVNSVNSDGGENGSESAVQIRLGDGMSAK